MAKATRLDSAEILTIIDAAIENDISFQLNVHNMSGLEAAVESAERIGGGRHNCVAIAQQPSCFVVSVEAGRGEVTFFVSKAQAMPAETPFN